MSRPVLIVVEKMGISHRGKIAVVIVVLVIAGSISFYTLDANDIEFIPGLGLCYISDIQGANDNSSYSVEFHGINFTFLYWYWPFYGAIENVTWYLAEQRVQVFVLVESSDGFSEVIQLEIDSPGCCIFDPNSILQGFPSSHQSRIFGIATANSEELHSNWVYFVSV